MTHLSLPPFPGYALLDSGDGMKYEQYGIFKVVRPESQALWSRTLPDWPCDAYFDKSMGWQGAWTKIPDISDWVMQYENLKWQCKWSPYRHVWVFPEQAMHWTWMRDILRTAKQNNKNNAPPKVLNLFAYTGIASIACALEWAHVTHVDASKPTIGWAQKNMALSGLPENAIRWILEDVVKFVEREVRRGNTYEGIIMDPPVFGHGANGEKWEFDTSFPLLLTNIRKILSPSPLFVVVNTYASSIFSTSLGNILSDILPAGIIEHGELWITQKNSEKSLTTGVYARWKQI